MRAGTRAHESLSGRTAEAARAARSGTASFVEGAAETVKQAASATASTLADELKELLNRQMGAGADKLGSVARSARLAAHDLEGESPAMADLVRTLASRVDACADDLRGQSIDQLWHNAADLTRRQPALVFGLAALAGFFALRVVKSSPSISAPSIQPSQQSYQSRREGVGYGS